MAAEKVKAGPDWMSKLPRYLWVVPLSSLAIPGSNHSYSFYTDKESNIDRAGDPIYRQFVDHFGEIAVDISYRWTVTQSKTLTQQLDMGIRYFDIRVTARGGDRDDKNVYLRNGPNIILALRELRTWLDMHPQEVIIIDFKVVNKMSAAQHKYLLANIAQDILEDMLLECTGNVKGITLENMWSVAKQVIVFYPKECIFDYLSVWPNDCIGHMISEDQTTKHMIQKLDSRHEHGRPTNMFYCYNGIVTPSNAYMAEHLRGTLKEKVSKPALRAILNWIRDKDIRCNEINIVVADCVDMYDFCTEVIRVNYGVRDLKGYEYNRNGACVVL